MLGKGPATRRVPSDLSSQGRRRVFCCSTRSLRPGDAGIGDVATRRLALAKPLGVAGMLIRLFILLLRPVPQSPPVSLCLKGEGGSGEVTSWEALGRSCFRLLFLPQPGPCSCRIMSCRQLSWSVSSSWVPLGSAQQLWQGAHARVPPVGCRAPAPGPHHTLCCCRWAKFPPGERDFPHSGRLLLPRRLPSLSRHMPAEAKVHVS